MFFFTFTLALSFFALNLFLAILSEAFTLISAQEDVDVDDAVASVASRSCLGDALCDGVATIAGYSSVDEV